MGKINLDISGVFLQFNIPEDIKIPENIYKFQTEAVDFVPKRSYFVEICDLEEFVPKDIKPIYRRDDIQVFANEGLETRVINIKGDDRPYGVMKEESPEVTRIYISNEIMGLMDIDTIFLSLFAVERLMVEVRKAVLHCNFIVDDGKAILFSAPSGAGKSTQGDLWVKHRGARVINGDRALLSVKDGRVYAAGWPICGSSEICFNEEYEVKAICFVKDWGEDKAEPADIKTSVTNLYREIMKNTWNMEFVDVVLGLIDEIVANVLCINLTCTVSENAVKAVEKVFAANNKGEK